MPLDACTIVSNNYLAFARVLAHSLQEHNPDAELHVLVVDTPHDGIDYDGEPFSVTFADQVGIPHFQNFAFRYSILEINTAVKPYFLEYLHRTLGLESVCYFDPDILITASLAPLYARVEASDVVLTPHILEPIEDDAEPSERDFLLSGTYNLGFLGLTFNPDTLRFLEWWQRRLWSHCLHRVEEGLFVDQKWANFAPSFLDRALVLREPSYNVAYWNLMHRTLEPTDAGWTVEGEPLRFFHFSGLVLDDPERVSKYQDRFRLSERPDLKAIFALYVRRLEEEGHAELQAIPYGWDRFDDGQPIPPIAREILREEDPEGTRWQNPFASEGKESFRAFLSEPAEPGLELPLPRIAAAVHHWRKDLHSVFPDPLGADASAYCAWFLTTGLGEMRIDPALVEDLSETFDGFVPPRAQGAPAAPTGDPARVRELEERLAALERFHSAVQASPAWRFLQTVRGLFGRAW